MEISSSAASTEYDRLIARHHAMRLRRQILAPAPAFQAPAVRGRRPGSAVPGRRAGRAACRPTVARPAAARSTTVRPATVRPTSG
ncbi:hypothetical protein ACFQ0M_06970 [Kitasatospora aburaviensis]